MAAISGANPIITSDINNFTGELFKITPHRTPLLAAAGGLNGGIVSNTTYFQFQTQQPQPHLILQSYNLQVQLILKIHWIQIRITYT